MNIHQLEAFVAVKQAGGFSNAAAFLHLSQPAISRRIGLLEDELGVKLFDRIHGGIILTEAGKVFLPHAQRVLAAMSDGKEAVKSIESQEMGLIKIAIVGSLAGTKLSTDLLQFRKHHPEVRLELRTALSSEVSEMVQSGEVHLGIRYFPDPSSHIVSQTIQNEDMVVVSSAQSQYDVLNHNRLKAVDLAGIPWIYFPAGTSGEPYTYILTRQLQAAGLESAEIITIDSLTAQKRLVETDFGLGLMPISSIEEELRLGTLQVLNIPELQTFVPVVLLFREKGYLSKAAQSLVNTFLKQ